jgi:hypothetical protein
MHVSTMERAISAFDPVCRINIREVAVQMSAQSRQMRTHWRMSISSAVSASAQDVQISAQNIAWRTASARGPTFSPASGWAAIIFSIDIGRSSDRANGARRDEFRIKLEPEAGLH